jgi:hypothetical protein
VLPADGFELPIKVDKHARFAQIVGQMIEGDSLTLLDRQLLPQLGDRLKRLRNAKDLGTVEAAKRVGCRRPIVLRRRRPAPCRNGGTPLPWR